MSMQASPGVYAVLLGSGASTASGVKTGWDIVKDLVSRVAAARDTGNPEAGAQAAAAPERWWLDTFGETLGYSALLEQVAKTPADRQAQLARYFEPEGGEDSPGGDKRPTAAHRAIAQLVKRGLVRVILTTNFDRLMERALDEVGISAQMIHQPSQYDSSMPLAHCAATVIKLHGDYADLEQRNTVNELEAYPEVQARFLERVLDEHGLIICGWSADWDKALVRALEGTRSRRYPLFWSHYGPLGEEGRRLRAQHSAAAIEGKTADELFTDLLQRIDALDRMSAPPISTDLAVVRLKRALPDPMQRIELSDLVNQTVFGVINKSTLDRHPLSGDVFESSLRAYRQDSNTLLHLLANGVFHDDGTYDHLWTRSLERLTRMRGRSTGTTDGTLEQLRHYPALLATWAMGLAAILSRREEFLPQILTQPAWAPEGSGNQPQSPLYYLNPTRILRDTAVHPICRSETGVLRIYPQSYLLRQELREPLRRVEPDDSVYAAACDRFEFIASMVAFDTIPEMLAWPWPGEFLLYNTWNHTTGLAERIGQELTDGWPLLRGGAFGGNPKQAQAAYAALVAWKSTNVRGS